MSVSQGKSFLSLFFVALVCLASACLTEDLPDNTQLIPSGNSGSGEEEENTPGVISSSNSIVTTTSPTCLQGGGSVTVKLRARDDNNLNLSSGGETVVFSAFGGTSVGSMGATTDNGDGTYTATYTCTTAGTAHIVSTTINGVSVTSSPPSVQVVMGAYVRGISLSPVTDQDELQVVLDLSASSFDYSKAASNGSDIRFRDSSGSFLDYWIEYWDSTGNSRVWIKIPDAGESQISFYYGNAFLTDGQNKEGVFTYSSEKELYVELSDRGGAGGVSTNVGSYYDSRSVTVEENGGASNQSLDAWEMTNFTQMIQGLIQADGPMVGRAVNSNGFDSIVPLIFAGTVMGYPDSRGNEEWHFYNPTEDNASVTITSYDNSGAIVGMPSLLTVNAKSFSSVAYSVSQLGLVTSDQPIVGYVDNSGTSDAYVMLPPSQRIVGVNSNAIEIGITQDGTTGTIYYSDGTSSSFSGNKGLHISGSGGGTQGAAEGVLVVADKPIFASSQADGDGSEAMTFMPESELDTEYLIPTDAQYLSVACTRDVDLEVYDESGGSYASVSCSPGANSVGFVFVGDATNVVMANGGLGGYSIVGDAPFFVYYEYSNQDETNVFGPKHGRLRSDAPPVLTLQGEIPLI